MMVSTHMFRFCILVILIFSMVWLGWSMVPQHLGLLTYIDDEGVVKEVRTTADWEKKREQIRTRMQLVMGLLPATSELGTPLVDTVSQEKRDGYTLFHIRFLAAPDEWATAFLYIPDPRERKSPLPAMLVLHGTGAPGKRLVDGESRLPNRAHARELAERGYVVIAPDYPSFGDLSDHDFLSDRYVSGTMKGIFNHMRAVDLLVGLEEVDPERIGVIGHSLGGHNAIFVGAFDERLKVVVSSCGWTLFDYYDIGEAGTKRYGGKLGPWAQDRYMPLMRDRYGLDAARIPFDFDEAISAIAPRAFYSNAPVNDANFSVEGVRLGISRISQVYQLYDAGNNLRVNYPDAGHDFPVTVRFEAFEFIDRILHVERPL
ncbi:alpha/beta hydrolase [Parapedobacter sp. 10938]|uniref:alpha/beta hydrolase n=1 Tax=Parapedobacter flavus TaxID=3110225 RepID=UPI002DB60845|nr:alpha/beta fold hydrolase [Parapedobacter sp. 10938]MEC3878312.1 alpha/beta fold hydrolase [Parapedobacter sp. 10938]